MSQANEDMKVGCGFVILLTVVCFVVVMVFGTIKFVIWCVT